jgi:YidC/Oxa1 family membrane protein insertase
MGLFNLLFVQPIYNLLILFSDIIPNGDIGWSIIIVTLIIKALLAPLTFKSLKAQREMMELQPKVAKIKEDFKDNQQKMAEELMKVYKEHNVNPFGSCLPLLIQLPIFLAIFQVLQKDLTSVDSDLLYSFVSQPEIVNVNFLGLIDISAVSVFLAVLAAAAQYFQVKTSMPPRPEPSVKKSAGALDEDVAATVQRFTLYFIPGITLIVGTTTLPAGVMLYWLVATIITIVTYKYFAPKKNEKSDTVEIEVLKD